MTTRRETLRPLIALAACAALACAVFALAACTVGGRLPSEPAGIIGTVTLVVPGDGRPASMLVETTGTPDAGGVADKASVTIAPTTTFFDAGGKAATLVDIARISKGTKLRVWFDGAVAESYPVQGTAKSVQLVEREAGLTQRQAWRAPQRNTLQPG